MTTWAEVNTTAPPAGRRLGRIGPLLVLLAVVVAATAWAYSRSGPSIPVVLGEVLVLVTLIRIASARVDHVIGHALTRFGHVVGRVLSVVLLLSVFVVVLVPVWALARLTGWDALEPVRAWRGRWQGSTRWWRARPPEPYLAEPTRPARTRLHSVAVVLVVALVGAGLFYELRIREDPVESHQVDEAVVTPDAGVFTGYFSLAAYQGQPWAEQYFLDLGSIPFAFDPYLILRVPDDYASAHVNVTDRVRHSYESPAAVAADDPIDVWFLGGSAAFGVGQRDEHTIPSELVRLAEAEGLPVRIQNLAMSGYVTWQDALLMGTRLVEQGPPDLVVDYNGSNDLSLHLGPGGARRISSLFADQVYPVLDAAGDRVFRPGLPDYMPRNTETDVDNAVRLYGQEVEFGRRIASAWDVPIAFFFQTALWTTDQAASIDPVLAAKGIDRQLHADNARAWDQVRAQLPDGVVDLADALDTAEVPVYADTVHTNEEGARLVAVAMYEHLRPQLQALAAGG